MRSDSDREDSRQRSEPLAPRAVRAPPLSGTQPAPVHNRYARHLANPPGKPQKRCGEDRLRSPSEPQDFLDQPTEPMPLSPAFATIHARASAWEAEVAARTATRVAVVTGRQLKAAVAPAVRAAVKVSGWSNAIPGMLAIRCQTRSRGKSRGAASSLECGLATDRPGWCSLFLRLA